MKQIVFVSLVACALGLISYQPAQAYLDPATGSYLFQLLLAGLLGALVTLKIYWKRVKAFLVGLFSNKSDESHNG